MPTASEVEALTDLVRDQAWVKVWYTGGDLAAEGPVVAVNLDPTLWIQQADGTQAAVSATLHRRVYPPDKLNQLAKLIEETSLFLSVSGGSKERSEAWRIAVAILDAGYQPPARGGEPAS
jgi:hypothetical protein